MNAIRVLVVDDEPLALEAHASYVSRVEGFEVVGRASTGAEAIAALRGTPVDLVLLDMTLPDIHGLDVCRAVRASDLNVDVFAITAVRDAAVVRSAVSLGIVQYLIKPFSFGTLADRLRSYRDFRGLLGDGAATQSDVDRSMAALRTTPVLPEKGLSTETLDRVREVIRGSEAPLSAAEVAQAASVSRVTARRYLEHLAELGDLDRSPRYGAPGRPELEYRRRR